MTHPTVNFINFLVKGGFGSKRSNLATDFQRARGHSVLRNLAVQKIADAFAHKRLQAVLPSDQPLV